MRQYRIDQIDAQDVARIRQRLQVMELGAGLDDIFWLPVPTALLTELQQNHHEQCGPYVMTLELEADAVTLELLVRARGRLRCECIGYATEALQTHMMRYVDTLLTDSGVSV